MPEPKDSRDEREEAAARYGWSLAMINSNPELKAKFRQARDQDWSAARFVAEMRETNWFKKHSEDWRNSQILKVTDPGTWDARQRADRARIRDQAAAMGALVSDAQIDRIAATNQMFGWNESELNNALASYVRTARSGELKGQYVGQAGKNAQQLLAIARNNGYKIPTAKMSDWQKAIASGRTSVDDYARIIRRQAATMYPTWKNELLAGADLADIASPYMERMAQVLELNPAKVSIFDPTIQKALASKNPKTGKPVAMPLYDFEDALRKDNRWQYTDNAHKEVIGFGRTVLSQMGLVN